MARPLRIEYPGALYHVTSRGNAKQKIFKNDRDRKFPAEGRDRKARDEALATAVSWGYTLKDITDHLPIHYTTVSKTLKRDRDKK